MKRPSKYRPRYIGDHIRIIKGKFRGRTGIVLVKHPWKSEGEWSIEWVYSVRLDKPTSVNIGKPFGRITGDTMTVGALPSQWIRIAPYS
jgi:hypothetical protein